ncbi:transglycosylase domain-containing protein [Capnocytophaga catalasegens]|uniref:Penicillin-binding protein 1A n=1 Tax=Capnocytophaga catalasegens TaxID=1004260 RepID=A0AAV5AW34_9FLAO|nr:transglycosylase domain-containing protein [Capnocytophaga catalasegens]GIZ16288.1 penicillin-binding protein 1A [Capnocytophaga catalasegens]GJM50520.1 penicillin-binding protein 1A [Capnocytophaga catalasegens]GJM53199.1 penicillin-binding protein 1A [Capnocytophaga catalasegens]
MQKFLQKIRPYIQLLQEKIRLVWIFLRQQSYKFYLKWAGISIGIGAFLFIFFITLVYFGAFGKLPSEKELKELKQAEASLVYDCENQLIGKFFIFDRTNIAYEDFPPYLIKALIATEDVRFRSHKGVDSKSLFRVFFKTILLQNDASGGGSTITMQLAKNIFGRKNSMPVNKIKEIFIARRIEKIYSKDEILTLYLNTVPFSDNTYGIESASQKFFGKSARQLTLNEAATLVGSLKATHNYNPRISLEKSQERRNTVLAQMKKYNLLSQEDFELNTKDSLAISYNYFSDNQGIAPYFREQIRLQVPELLKDVKKSDGTPYNLYKDGLRIYTTLDKTMQEYAENAVEKHMPRLQKDFETSYGKKSPWDIDNQWFKDEVKKLSVYKKLQNQGFSEQIIWNKLSQKKAMDLSFYERKDTILNHSTLDSISFYIRLLNTGFVAIDPKTGAIRSYVGGIDFEKFKYDHVVQSQRQVGSTFKPFIYATAIEYGMPACTHFSPNPITYTDYENWTPTNSSQIEADEHTYFSIGKALRESINTIAVQTLFYVGMDNVVSKIKQLGIKSEIPRVPSIALGTIEMTMLDLARAYSIFGNKGTTTTPYFIEKITDKEGKILWAYSPKKEKQVLSETTIQTMIELMRGTINQGTASRMRGQYGISNDIAGKTGTTQENKDGWFAAVTPNLLMISWVGNDRQIGFRSTRIGQGANSALPITAIFLQQLNRNTKYKKISKETFEVSEEIKATLTECEPIISDNFFERLFSGKTKDSLSGNGLFRIYKPMVDSLKIITPNEGEIQNETQSEVIQHRDDTFFEQKPKKKSLFEKLFGRK